MANRKSWKTGHHWILFGQSGGISMVARSPLNMSSGLPESAAQSKHLPRDPFSLPAKRSSWAPGLSCAGVAGDSYLVDQGNLLCRVGDRPDVAGLDGYPPTAAPPIDVELPRVLLHATRDAQIMNVCRTNRRARSWLTTSAPGSRAKARQSK